MVHKAVHIIFEDNILSQSENIDLSLCRRYTRINYPHKVNSVYNKAQRIAHTKMVEQHMQSKYCIKLLSIYSENNECPASMV